MQMLSARIALPTAFMLAIKLAIWWRFAIPLALLGVRGARAVVIGAHATNSNGHCLLRFDVSGVYNKCMLLKTEGVSQLLANAFVMAD